MASSIKAFVATIDDEENALPPAQPVVLHDVTFLRANVESIRIWVPLDQVALLLSCGTVDLAFNDWAGVRFSERLVLKLPDVTLAAVDPESSARHRGARHHRVSTLAHFKTSVDLRMVERKAKFTTEREKQQEHIRVHDQRTHRTPWLLLDEGIDTGELHTRQKQNVNPPAMPFPFMPEPLKRIHGVNYDSSSSSSKSEFRANLSRKSSFLSFRSSDRSSTPSVRRHLKTPKSAASWAQSSRTSVPLSGYAQSFRPNTRQSNVTADQRLPRYNNHANDDISTSVMAFSSPWVAPYFPLQKINPDTQEIPELPPLDDTKRRDSHNEDGDVKYASSKDYEEATHVYFRCDLSTGLTGFCTPKFLQSLSSLIGGMQPVLPVDVLDNLQAGVVSDILKHLKSVGKPEKITNFSLSSPAMRIRLINPLSGGDGDIHERDTYDIASSHPCLTLRSRLNLRHGDLVAKENRNLHSTLQPIPY